ncbi:MAG: hypothetical protein RLY93_07380 [Sumerlaeia bacterium]
MKRVLAGWFLLLPCVGIGFVFDLHRPIVDYHLKLFRPEPVPAQTAIYPGTRFSCGTCYYGGDDWWRPTYYSSAYFGDYEFADLRLIVPEDDELGLRVVTPGEKLAYELFPTLESRLVLEDVGKESVVIRDQAMETQKTWMMNLNDSSQIVPLHFAGTMVDFALVAIGSPSPCHARFEVLGPGIAQEIVLEVVSGTGGSVATEAGHFAYASR